MSDAETFGVEKGYGEKIVEWINSFENGGKAFKHEVDESFERVQAFFDKMESL